MLDVFLSFRRAIVGLEHNENYWDDRFCAVQNNKGLGHTWKFIKRDIPKDSIIVTLLHTQCDLSYCHEPCSK